jgi:hypothetical protein
MEETPKDTRKALYKILLSLNRRIDWNAVTGASSAIALFLLAVTLIYNAAEIRTSRNIAQAQSVMDYYILLQQYNDVQQKLITGGEWSTPGTGPQTNEEWYRVSRYMGLLEQIEVFVQGNVVSLEVADENYSHRVRAIYRNDLIRQRQLEEQAFRWKLFLKLVKRLETMPVYQGLRQRDGGK